MSLFRNISGRRSEDIATEVIARLLSRDGPHVPFQKLFFGRVLGMAVSSDQLRAETTTQPSSQFGRPDLVILTDEALIVLETKLGAYLSGDDQLVRYGHLFESGSLIRSNFPFADPERVNKKVLVLLAPARTIDLSQKAPDYSPPLAEFPAPSPAPSSFAIFRVRYPS